MTEGKRLQMIQQSLTQERIPICVVYVLEREKKIYHIAGVDKPPSQELLNDVELGLRRSVDWELIKPVLSELKVDIVKTDILAETYKEYIL